MGAFRNHLIFFLRKNEKKEAVFFLQGSELPENAPIWEHLGSMLPLGLSHFFLGDIHYCILLERGCGEMHPLDSICLGSGYPTTGNMSAVYFSCDFFCLFLSMLSSLFF